MATSLIETHSRGAEIHRGAICNEKFPKFLEEFSVPKGLFHVGEIVEFGTNRSTGFFWLKLKKKADHKLNSRETLIYETEITSFIEPRHLSKITGLKGKDLFISGAVCDIQVGVPASDKIKLGSNIGLSRVKPISLFT